MPAGGLRLLVLAPLRVEALALGPRPTSRVGPATLAIERVGMGLTRAAGAAQRLAAACGAELSEPVKPTEPIGAGGGAPGRTGGVAPGRTGGGAPAPAAVVLAGLGGALAEGLRTGDIVVADRVIDSQGREIARLPSAPLLAGELVRMGLPARTGTVVSTDHIVTGQERADLAALSAHVVDMESAAVAPAPWGVPFAVVRAVSDSPGAELYSPAGLKGIAKALRNLHAARPALANWAAAAGPKEIVLAEPRSFCAGVRRAIETVERVLERYGAPVYVRRQIVHNGYVVSRLEAAGAVFVKELAEVPDGATVVFSAHGVGVSVHEEAKRRNMMTIDATCPLVSKVHNEARRYAASGRQIVLVGHKDHDEVEGTLGTVPGTVLVTTAADVAELALDAARPTALITQTTLTPDEVAEVTGALAERFTDLAQPAASDICYASHNRQEAVRAMAADCDVVLVLGSSNSSNSQRLVEVAERCGTKAHLVDSKSDLCLSWLAGVQRVGLTAGASAPEALVQELVGCLAGLGPLSISERSTGDERVSFPLPMEVR
jgi:4-hydroxy-3-methylbut-2-enyl diphosphate reductase